MSAHDRRRDRRQREATLIKVLYPSLSWMQVRLLLRHARHVRLPGGESLEHALGR